MVWRLTNVKKKKSALKLCKSIQRISGYENCQSADGKLEGCAIIGS